MRSDEIVGQASRLLAPHPLVDAVALVAMVRPVQAEDEELPDVVED